MAPATRKLIRIMPENEFMVAEMFNALLGDDIPARKKFISEKGAEYIDLADI